MHGTELFTFSCTALWRECRPGQEGMAYCRVLVAWRSHVCTVPSAYFSTPTFILCLNNRPKWRITRWVVLYICGKRMEHGGSNQEMIKHFVRKTEHTLRYYLHTADLSNCYCSIEGFTMKKVLTICPVLYCTSA